MRSDQEERNIDPDLNYGIKMSFSFFFLFVFFLFLFFFQPYLHKSTILNQIIPKMESTVKKQRDNADCAYP